MAVMENLRAYTFNLETTKIELYFTKEEYSALSQKEKKKLQSAFIFSGRNKCWVSRAKEPNLYKAKQVANCFGFTQEIREGERLTFAEQFVRKVEKAEKRAEKYGGYAHNAVGKAEALQEPLNHMRGDIAFFTQPIIAGHSGSQSFARQRERMFERYRKGFDEYRKSEYFKNRAVVARGTASMDKLNDKGYLDRRIKECETEIRKREKNLISYEEILYKIESDECPTKWDGTAYTIEEITGWINRELELIEVVQDKEGFYRNCIDELGGVQFSRSNIEVGYLVTLKRWGTVEVVGKGTKNITYKILTGGAAGCCLKAAYAEIIAVERTELSLKKRHPFVIGETFTAVKYEYPDSNSFKSIKKEIKYEIIKTSDTTIQLKEKETKSKPIIRKPREVSNGSWAFSIDDRNENTFYKRIEK